jgi:uncharacterized protein (TIGR02466 family)
MEPIDLVNLFPIPLLKTKLYSDDIDIIKNDIIKNHEKYVDIGNVNDEMNSDGENAYTKLETNEKYFSLVDKINEIAKESLKKIYCYDDDLDPYLCTMWSTCCCPGESGEDHYHSNSFFSGSFYPFDETPSEIRFYSPNQEKVTLNVNGNISEWNYYNSTTYTIKPQKCDLLLFPSYLKHKVLRNSTQNVRYSLSFNIFLRGTLKAETSNLYLP